MMGADNETKGYARFAKRLNDLGYDTTPVDGKQPVLGKWQQRPPAAQDYNRWQGYSIGVLCGGKHNIVAVDIDVQNEQAASEIGRLAEDALGFAPIRIGQAPKALMVYRCSEPTRKRKTPVFHVDDKDAAVEVLAEGQQFVASGIHPMTGKKYHWPSDSLLEMQPADLTEITPEQINEFLYGCQAILSHFGEIKAQSHDSSLPLGGFDFAANEQQGRQDEISAAVAAIPNPDLHYDDWIRVAHAIKGALGEDGFTLFDSWSGMSDKYDATETERAWSSIKSVRSIGAGAIYHLAKEHGGFDIKEYRQEHAEETADAAVEEAIAEEQEKTDENPLIGTVFTVGDALPPPREWLYGRKFLRRHSAIVAAPGGVGKTAWITAAALSLASGKQLLQDKPHTKLRVLVYNLEDDGAEIRRRLIAAMKHYGLQQQDIEDRIQFISGRERPLCVMKEINGDLVAMPDAEALQAFCKAHSVDVLILDPYLRSHRVPENSNEAQDAVVAQYNRIADHCRMAIILVHHTTKGADLTSGDAIRGGGSLQGGARSAYMLQPMQSDIAAKLGVQEKDRKRYVQVHDAKGNMALQALHGEWIFLESQELGNGNDEYPDGDSVQVATAWRPPDPFDGMDVETCRRVLEIIDAGLPDGRRYTKNKQASDRWAGDVISSMVKGKTPEQASHVLAAWLKEGTLKERSYRNEARRKDEPGLFLDRTKMPETSHEF